MKISAVKTGNPVMDNILRVKGGGIAMSVTLRLKGEVMRKDNALLAPFVNSESRTRHGDHTENNKNPFHSFKMGSHTHFCKDGALTC